MKKNGGEFIDYFMESFKNLTNIKGLLRNIKLYVSNILNELRHV